MPEIFVSDAVLQILQESERDVPHRDLVLRRFHRTQLLK